MPEERGMFGTKPVPRATESGKQEGRESPKEQKMRMLAELSARKNKPSKPTKVPKVPKKVLEAERKAGIKLAGVPEDEDEDQGQVVDQTPLDRIPDLPPIQPDSPARKRQPAVRRPRKAVETKTWFSLSIEIPDVGTFTTPATDVLEAGYGLVVLAPGGQDVASFVPNPGTMVVLGMPDGGKQECYYPGVCTELPDGKTKVLVFIKASHAPADETPA